jgi:hypothetical protein
LVDTSFGRVVNDEPGFTGHAEVIGSNDEDVNINDRPAYKCDVTGVEPYTYTFVPRSFERPAVMPNGLNLEKQLTFSGGRCSSNMLPELA